MTATLIDSNVIIDLLEPASPWAAWSKARITDVLLKGLLAFNVVIASEVAHEFATKDRYD